MEKLNKYDPVICFTTPNDYMFLELYVKTDEFGRVFTVHNTRDELRDMNIHRYVIPYDKFDIHNMKETLKHNIQVWE